MTDEERKKLRELAEAATQGPWDTRAERNCPRAIVIAGTEQIADAGEHTHWTDEQCARNAAFIAAANPQTVIALLDEIDRLRGALEKISAIRDSIVGMQGFNFSEHAYPLVAALSEAGFEGIGYELARKNLGTLIEQLAAMTKARDEACDIACDFRDGIAVTKSISTLRKVGSHD